MLKKKKLVVVLGPTAIGKTAFSIALANHFHTEIISADSRQFYRELNIGVARPSSMELSSAPHHFIGFLSVKENFSAGDFERESLATLSALHAQHDVVVCCGGSMMYVDALLYGLDELPSDKELRVAIQHTIANEGLSVMVDELKALDPEYARQVDLNNPHRIIRAVEVCRLTGKKYSELRKAATRDREFEIIKIGLTSSRNWLYNRINLRVDQMMSNGFLEEAKTVYALRDLNALQTVGYRELFEYFDGMLSIEEAVEKIKQHTRNFAKRQMTWWRRDEKIHWVDLENNSNEGLNQALRQIGEG